MQEAAAALYPSPLLWVRMAEACLGAHERGIILPVPSAAQSSNGGPQPKQDAISPVPSGSMAGSSHPASEGELRQTAMLQFALHCAQNSVSLLNAAQVGSPDSQLGQDTSLRSSRPEDIHSEFSRPADNGSSAQSSSMEATEYCVRGSSRAQSTSSSLFHEEPGVEDAHDVKRAALAALAQLYLALGDAEAALRAAKMLAQVMIPASFR